MLRTKRILLAAVFLGLFLFLQVGSPQTQITAVRGADGTAGSIEIMTSNMVSGQPVTLRCYDLTASGDYTIDFSAGSATQHNFTAASDASDYYHTTIIEEPTAGGACTLTLEAQSTGTALYTVYLNFVTVETLIPTEVLIALAIALMVVGILVGIAASVKKKKG